MGRGGEVEEALGRVRILRELARRPERSFSKYSLIKATGLDEKSLSQKMRKLEEHGFIEREKTLYRSRWTHMIKAQQK